MPLIAMQTVGPLLMIWKKLRTIYCPRTCFSAT